MNVISTLDDLDRLLRVAEVKLRDDGAHAHYELLISHRLDGALVPEMPTDPFSDRYTAAVLDFHSTLSGRMHYEPRRDELNRDDVIDPMRAFMYRAGDTAILGQYVEAFGQILRVLNLKAGAHVIEFGPGEGQLSLMLARSGIDVTAIDLEPRYLDSIRTQAAALGTSIRLIQGEFLDDHDVEPADVILFFETFHHALHHQKLLERVRSLLKPRGRIVFSGEPILEPESPWHIVVPYPWGLRLAGLSLWRIRSQGWMELGFREDYFYEVLKRSGFSVEKITSLTNGRGTCYVAQANDHAA
jgi:2-polyprenyl-3-methyl-5-hydroxy-6-metoxy-1,4-benzoquinol methylase